MKQKKTLEGTIHSVKKPSIRKMGTMLGTGILCVLTIGTIGAMSVIGNPEVTSGKETTAADKKTEFSGYIDWKKAGVEEYDLVNKAEIVKTSATALKTSEADKKSSVKEAETTVKETVKKNSSAIESINSKVMYVKEAVNFRTGASKNNDIIKVLDAGKKVTVNGKSSDGWYRINADGITGYCMAEYLTDSAPVNVKKTSTVSEKKTTSVSSNVNSGTISYTNEEFEMMCYVLQNEAGGCSDESKIAVANVIINRVKSPSFPNTLKGVLTANNQFTAISNYYNKVNAPTQNTKDCVRRALNGEDNSKGAIFYYAPKYCGSSSAAWFETLNFCMELEGQRFFKY